MIRSSRAVEAAVQQGRTVCRLTAMAGGTDFRWVLTDTNETVHGGALQTLIRKGAIKPIATDLTGEPMQYGAAS